MNRQEVIELSPWLLNGTLSESEREELLTQLRESVESRTDLADTAFVVNLFSRRPSTETLLALAYDEPISSADRELFELQQELDPEITAELELARMSRRLLEEEDVELLQIDARPPEAAAATSDEIPAAVLDRPTVARREIARPEIARRRLVGWQLLAVAALLAVVPTALWLQSHQQLAELRAERTLAPGWVGIDLGVSRGASAPKVWQVAAGDVLEILPRDATKACSSCWVEVTAQDGTVVDSSALKINNRFYQLQIHQPPGRYSVAIFAVPATADGPPAAGAEPENRFEVEVVDGAPG